MNNNAFKKYVVLGILFVFPIVIYLFFASGINNFAKLFTIGKYCISLTLKIVSIKIELSKYIQLTIHLGNMVARTKKNKKIYLIFLDIKK